MTGPDDAPRPGAGGLVGGHRLKQYQIDFVLISECERCGAAWPCQYSLRDQAAELTDALEDMQRQRDSAEACADGMQAVARGFEQEALEWKRRAERWKAACKVYRTGLQHAYILLAAGKWTWRKFRRYWEESR